MDSITLSPLMKNLVWMLLRTTSAILATCQICFKSFFREFFFCFWGVLAATSRRCLLHTLSLTGKYFTYRCWLGEIWAFIRKWLIHERMKMRCHGLANLQKQVVVAFGALLLSQVKCMVAGGDWSWRMGPGQPWEGAHGNSVRWWGLCHLWLAC